MDISHAGSVTDIAGIEVGCWSDHRRATGCTVVLCRHGAVAAVDIRGGAPGSRETDLLAPGMLVDRVHAIVLAGGSAFGLAAANGVMRWLASRGHGFPAGPEDRVVPIVPAAVIFDRAVGDPDAFPGDAEGLAACEARSTDVPEGRYGAGTGCTIAKLGSGASPLPGGQGTASTLLHHSMGGHIVGALMVVNAAGSIRDGSATPVSTAWFATGAGGRTTPLSNTTIGVVATAAPLGRDGATRVAAMAHDGLARALDPVHTPFDGDAIFVISTAPPGLAPVDAVTIAAIGTAAAHVTELAVRRGVAAGQSIDPAGPNALEQCAQ